MVIKCMSNLSPDIQFWRQMFSICEASWTYCRPCQRNSLETCSHLWKFPTSTFSKQTFPHQEASQNEANLFWYVAATAATTGFPNATTQMKDFTFSKFYYKAWSNLRQEIQFLKCTGTSNFQQATPNYLIICIHLWYICYTPFPL